MSLVTLRQVLQDARKRKYAVGGFNVFNFETLGAVVEVAEELKAPLVLGIAERLFKFVDVDTLAAAMARTAQRSSVPIALHLDHGHSFDGVMKAVRWGFTSVMFDGSTLALAENLKKTKEITRIAHSLGMSVEGELGYVGFCASESAVPNGFLVTAEEAADFVEKTKIDALAIAVGDNHGVHRGGSVLNLERLSELHTLIDVPLVLHGGSKMSREDCLKSIENGICKINIATDMSLSAAERLKAELAKNPSSNYIHLMSSVKKGVKDLVRKYMLNFDCISRSI